MEANFTPVWSEESEMIAHMQSMFWSKIEADCNLPSPNTSSDSCVTTSTVPSLPHIQNQCYCAVSLVNTSMDWCLVHHTQTITATTNASAGEKRMFAMHEERNKSKNTNKKPRTFSQPWRTLSLDALDDEANPFLAKQKSSWGCSSEDHSNSMCRKSAVLKQSGSSQSLYAKKRRERINEKLRVLQQLIPNGTKVDISTMLEEAVQYVKFLQLQIKLLSSDETWMYAPLAYHGVGIDLSASANPATKQ